VDPTSRIAGTAQSGFRAAPIPLARRRVLYARWTGEAARPHEAFVGLMALLHGASSQELRGLRLADIDVARHRIVLGRRPHPVPLDPASWRASSAAWPTAPPAPARTRI
jgi:integrase